MNGADASYFVTEYRKPYTQNSMVVSIHGVPIRLNAERWHHITIGHPEMTSFYEEIGQTIEAPDTVYEGTNGAKIAVRRFEKVDPRFIVVVYREVSMEDGFVITAYISSKHGEFSKKKLLWQAAQS